jgi:hypothetical protein
MDVLETQLCAHGKPTCCVRYFQVSRFDFSVVGMPLYGLARNASHAIPSRSLPSGCCDRHSNGTVLELLASCAAALERIVFEGQPQLFTLRSEPRLIRKWPRRHGAAQFATRASADYRSPFAENADAASSDTTSAFVPTVTPSAGKILWCLTRPPSPRFSTSYPATVPVVST